MTVVPDTAAGTTKGTEYVVLSLSHDAILTPGEKPASSDKWIVAGTVHATSAESAIREIGALAGTYVAVPARSWKPVRVKVEQVSRVRLEQA